jgi:hypothetical protein
MESWNYEKENKFADRLIRGRPVSLSSNTFLLGLGLFSFTVICELGEVIPDIKDEPTWKADQPVSQWGVL